MQFVCIVIYTVLLISGNQLRELQYLHSLRIWSVRLNLYLGNHAMKAVFDLEVKKFQTPFCRETHGATTLLNSVELNNFLSVFPCRSIFYEERGHGKIMLITFELLVILRKQTTSTKCINIW